MAILQIADRNVGDGHAVFLVAECGINHNGSLDMALQMIQEAADSGVDAVKFQLFRADGMYTPDAGLYKTASGEKVPIYSLMEDVELPLEWIPKLSGKCRELDLCFIMTVCDEWCVGAMGQYDFDVYKIASYEISHLPMLREISQRDMPIIMSTGAADMSDVLEAVNLLTPDKQRPLGVLQCTAKYPAKLSEINLSVIDTLSRIFPNIVPGYSDHTEDPVRAPVQAVYHGAKIIEKHFTLDRNLPGADHCFAVDPPDLTRMVSAVREAEVRLEEGNFPQLDETIAGSTVKRLTEAEQMLRDFAYRGIFATRKISSGEPLTTDNIAVLRPGELQQGLHPRYFKILASGNYVATRDVAQYRGLQWNDVLSSR